MAVQALLPEPGRVDEPRAAKEYSDVLTQVACDHKPVIVRRNGADLAAVIVEPLERDRHAEFTIEGGVDRPESALAKTPLNLEAPVGREAVHLHAATNPPREGYQSFRDRIKR